ncbi:hypothetical protein FRC01_002454 [Tulasnella sp. 417]|nr:hypothetical protein FRC01_002454 [Tulasnella sp. 417]
MDPSSSIVIATTSPSQSTDIAADGSENYIWTTLDSTLIWIKVEDEIFRLPFRILTHGAEGLHGILLAAIQTEAPNSETDPCVMPAQVQLSNWKAWLQYRSSFGAAIENVSQGPRFWEGVLDIASLFMDDQGRQVAINHLTEGPSQCRDARKVFLGRKHAISGWLAPAFRSLIMTNPYNLTSDDIGDLDTDHHGTYLQITRIRHDVIRWQRERLLRAARVVHEDSNCQGSRRPRCEQAWVMHYRLSLIPLNHPSEDISAERVLTRMEGDPGPQEMGIGCWTRSVAALRNETDFLTRMDNIIEQGVTSLVGI